VLAFGLGIVFSFIFDTMGPRTRVLARETDREVVPDEEVHDYRREPEGTVVRDDETVARTGPTDERTVVTRRDTP
jgi:hypothetical protein